MILTCQKKKDEKWFLNVNIYTGQNFFLLFFFSFVVKLFGAYILKTHLKWTENKWITWEYIKEYIQINSMTRMHHFGTSYHSIPCGGGSQVDNTYTKSDELSTVHRSV